MYSKKKRLALILILLSVASLIYFSAMSYIQGGLIRLIFDGDASGIVDVIKSYGTWSFFVFFALIVLESVLAPFPPMILYITGGSLFGGFVSGTIALVANIVGAGIAFKIAHHYGKDWVLPKIPEKIEAKFSKIANKYGPLSIFILRVNPLTSSDLFSYLAGITNMKFWKFLIGTGLGLLPIVYIQTYFGEGIQSNPMFSKVSLIVGIVYVVIFIFAYLWIKRKIKMHIRIHLRKQRINNLHTKFKSAKLKREK